MLRLIPVLIWFVGAVVHWWLLRSEWMRKMLGDEPETDYTFGVAVVSVFWPAVWLWVLLDEFGKGKGAD